MANVQSMTVTLSPKWFIISSNSAFATNGLSSCKIWVCDPSSSSTFLRFPKRVLRLITRLSRKLSIGGFVTWLKFWRKKCDSGRYILDNTALGVSSPIDAIISLPSSAIGASTCSNSSTEYPAATCRLRRLAPSNTACSGTSRNMPDRSTTFSTHAPNGWAAAN